MGIRLRVASGAIALVLGVTGTAGTAAAGTASAATMATGAASAPAARTAQGGSLPASPVGRQVRWLVEASHRLPLPAAELRAHVDQGLLTAVGGTDRLNTALANVAGGHGLSVVSVLAASSRRLVALVDGAQRWQLSATVDAKGLFGELQFIPYRASPTSWAELDRRLHAVAPEVSFQIAQLLNGGRCVAGHGMAADTSRPLGSAFKLYVLAALAHAVAAGQASWSEKLAIRDDWKSLPSGVLQNSPAGTTYTLEQYARYMISISDNTAADHLIHRLGRARIERELVRAGVRRPALDIPFLTTRELFQFKAAPDYPGPARSYLRLPRAKRLAYLTRVVDPRPLTGLAAWQKPREIDNLEWFASPMDLCRVYADLAAVARTRAGGPVAAILSVNDGSLGLDRARWRTVWFKGGSEPGVLTLAYLVRDERGRTFVVAVEASNSREALDEVSAIPELLALARGGVLLGSRQARPLR